MPKPERKTSHHPEARGYRLVALFHDATRYKQECEATGEGYRCKHPRVVSLSS